MNYSTLQTTQERKVVFSMMLSSILPLLDSSIINVVLPDIANDIDASSSHIQWAVTAYMLSCSAGILLSPFINKKIGIKSSWMYSMMIFFLGSVLVGLSINMVFLITSRCIQGIGAGLLMPLSQSVLAIQFGKERLKSVMALIAIPAVFAPALGPVFGAVLSDVINWRVVFFINAPIILLSLFVGCNVITQTDKKNERINMPVFLFFFISLIVIFISIDGISSDGNVNNYSIIMLPVGFLFLFASVILNNQSVNAVINLMPLKNGEYSLSILMGFLTSFVFFSFLIFFPLVKSEDGGGSVIYIGCLLALQGVGAWLARKFVYQKINNCNSFLIIGASVMISAVSILFIERGGVFAESAGFLIRGSGLGIATILTLSSPFEFCDKKYIHDTSALTRVVQQIGGACGGLMSGFLINLIGEKAISIHSAYQIFIFSALFIGLFSMIATFLLKMRN